jgi:hypothetical protein
MAGVAHGEPGAERKKGSGGAASPLARVAVWMLAGGVGGGFGG